MPQAPLDRKSAKHVRSVIHTKANDRCLVVGFWIADDDHFNLEQLLDQLM